MSVNIIFIGFYPDHELENDYIYLNTLKNKNYNITKILDSQLTENILQNSDVIICGSFLQNIDLIKLIFPHRHKIIYNVTEPIEINNTIMYELYINNFINLAIGCVPENNNNIKFPIYIDPYNFQSCDKIVEINEYNKNLQIEELLTKNFCCLINKHDFGNTRVNIHNKLSEIGTIFCPSVLLNNFSNETFEKIGRETFQKQFIFSICPENYITKLDGYITEKLFMACCCGNIPIYYGKLDDFDKHIFNTNRIIFFDPTSIDSINNAYNFIKELMSDPIKLFNYYKQDIFCNNACDIINYFKNNANNRINLFINNLVEKTNESNNELNNENIYYKDDLQNENNYNDAKILNYTDLINYMPNICSDTNESNIIINLSTTLDNLKSDNFKLLIDKLINQTLKPKFIFVKVDIDEDQSYSIINNDYPTLIINCYKSTICTTNCTYQSFSNIENLFNMSEKIDKNDKIVFINDKFDPDNNFILMYELCYQLYNCNAIISKNVNSDSIFLDNYYDDMNINDSYSFKFSSLKNLSIDNLSTQEIELENYYKKNNLYVCCINKNNGCEIINSASSESDNNENLIKHHRYNEIDSYISKRYLLFNTDDITYDPFKNDHDNKQIDIKYYNKNIIFLTVTYFIENDIPLKDTINLDNYTINIINSTQSNKITVFFIINKNINSIKHNDVNYHIFQTDKLNNISINKFYSILTILNYLPDLEYKFFNDIDIINMIDKNVCISNLYNNLNDINFKLDLFKIWYLYNNGGLYFNCKNILYTHLNSLLNHDEFYVNDLKDFTTYTHLLFNKQSKNINIKILLINMCFNIFNLLYGNNCPAIINSMLLNKIINKSILDINIIDKKFEDFLFTENKIIKYNNNILVKLSYNNYYKNHNSITTKSFNLWRNNLTYNSFKINYSNINYVDHLVWINLDRCENRKIYMENLLQNIEIPNTRISGIDGGIIDLSTLNNLERPLANYEKAVTLSHIKAINYLNNIDGHYFCVFEDDISLNNTILFNHDLKYIIDNAPKFDILILSKTYDQKLNDMYTKWNSNIFGAVCYIISREGINKITSFAKYDQNNNSFEITKKLSIADWFLYNNTNSYVYKYNYISSLDNESIIHPEHLDIHKNSSIIQLQTIFEDFL